jgi:hypothetical protein
MGLLGIGRLGRFIAVRMGMPMTTVRAGNQVIVSQRGDRTHRHRFFPGIQMRGALEDGLAEQASDIVLQSANLQHLAEHRHQFVFGEFLFLHDRRHLLNRAHLFLG